MGIDSTGYSGNVVAAVGFPNPTLNLPRRTWPREFIGCWSSDEALLRT